MLKFVCPRCKSDKFSVLEPNEDEFYLFEFECFECLEKIVVKIQREE